MILAERRGSSTVERSFRKAEVEGSIPFFGCFVTPFPVWGNKNILGHD